METKTPARPNSGLTLAFFLLRTLRQKPSYDWQSIQPRLGGRGYGP
jgi:hypothetical protein